MRGQDGRYDYQFGSAAPAHIPARTTAPARAPQRPARKVSEQTRKNRERAKGMNLGIVISFMFVMTVFGMSLFGELSLQAKNTELRREIASMKSELNTLKMENEEEYSRIMGSVDMQQIKNRAIDDLGMQYAQSGQVIVVPDATDDYVHQYKDLP